MNDIVPYQEVKLENQSVDEIVEDIGILKKIEEASKFEIGRRLVYLKETCKRGEYLPKLEEIGISQPLANEYRNFFDRFAKYQHVDTLGIRKMRELLGIPKGQEEEYLDKIREIILENSEVVNIEELNIIKYVLFIIYKNKILFVSLCWYRSSNRMFRLRDGRNPYGQSDNDCIAE